MTTLSPTPRRRAPAPAGQGTPALELLLPLKPFDAQRGSDLLRVRDGLFASLNRFCDPDFVDRMTIVVPDADLAAMEEVREACDLTLVIIPESHLIGTPPAMPRHGWHVQQLIKIAYAAQCAAPWYITLDADALLVDFLDARVMEGSRAPLQTELREAHPLWWPASAAVLLAPPVATDPVISVTPAFLSTEIVRRVIDRLSRVAAGRRLDWVHYLASQAKLIDEGWTEYTLYWTTLLATGTPETFYYERDTLVFCQSVHEARSRIAAGAHGQEALFGIVQSSAVDDASHAAYAAWMLRGTEPATDPRRALGLHGGYRHIHPAHARELLEQAAAPWVVSAGPGSARLCGCLPGNTAPEPLRHFAAPLPGGIAVPAIYVIDAPEQALAAMAAGRQADICRNNNINFSPAFYRGLTAAEYLASGEDLLDLERHLPAWTDPDGALGQADYELLIVRGDRLAEAGPQVAMFLGLAPADAAALQAHLAALPPPPDLTRPLRQAARARYATLIDYIDAFPTVALWQPGADTLLALEV